MNMHKIAYSFFIAFVASLLILVSVSALSSSDRDETDLDGLDPITLDELADHDDADSCWKAIDGRVYDFTDYVPKHPTDPAVILEWCGREATEGWDNKRPGVPHSRRAQEMLEEYLIGRLVDSDGEPVAAETSATAEEATDTAEARLSPAEDERLHRALLGLPLDGHYRGVFIDRGVIQVNISFDLEDGRFTRLGYRSLMYRDDNYLDLVEGDELYPVMRQHRQILERLNGEPVTAIFSLYEPARLADDIDGYSGATLRGAKILSAMRDALNRGVYRWP